jgi:predicted RNA-binding protein with PUA-like domain
LARQTGTGKYSFNDLIREGATEWTGVRNFQARNNLRAMKTGDRVLFYHSVSEKSVAGVAEVSREAFPDSTDETGKWIAVEIKPTEKFAKPVLLDKIKTHGKLQKIGLIKQSRLSVMPLSADEFEIILSIAKG